jgi:hypothetical protein
VIVSIKSGTETRNIFFYNSQSLIRSKDIVKDVQSLRRPVQPLVVHVRAHHFHSHTSEVARPALHNPVEDSTDEEVGAFDCGMFQF